MAQAEFIIECGPAYHFPIPQAVVILRYPRCNGPRNRHILLDTIAGSTKNMSYIVAFGRLKSFRSNGKKEWMLFSLLYIPLVHDEWADFIIPRRDCLIRSRNRELFDREESANPQMSAHLIWTGDGPVSDCEGV